MVMPSMLQHKQLNMVQVYVSLMTVIFIISTRYIHIWVNDYN